MTFNSDNISNWVDKENFLRLSRKFLDEGKWKSLSDFNYLEYLIGRITNEE